MPLNDEKLYLFKLVRDFHITRQAFLNLWNGGNKDLLFRTSGGAQIAIDDELLSLLIMEETDDLVTYGTELGQTTRDELGDDEDPLAAYPGNRIYLRTISPQQAPAQVQRTFTLTVFGNVEGLTVEFRQQNTTITASNVSVTQVDNLQKWTVTCDATLPTTGDWDVRVEYNDTTDPANPETGHDTRPGVVVGV